MEDFISGLPLKHKAKAIAVVKLLEEQGPNLLFPYSSQIRGRLRELRIQQGKDKTRILYFGDARRWFILLHGLLKRTDKLSESDIRVAEARMERHNARLARRA